MSGYSLTPVLITWKKGPLFTIAIRIIINRVPKYASIGHKVTLEEWDVDKNKVMDSHPNANRLNQLIKKKKNELEANILEKDIQNIKVTAAVAKESVNNTISKDDFYAFANKWLNAVETGDAYASNFKYASSTLIQMRTELSKLASFKPRVRFNDITDGLISDYLNYMSKTLKNSENTQWKSFKALRKFCSVAKKKKIIGANPFSDFDNKPKYTQSIRDFLVGNEVQLLKTEIIDKVKEEDPVYQVTCWFLLSCYAGFRYSDLVDWDEEKYRRDNRLILGTTKTGSIVSVPIMDDLHDILERVKRLKPIFSDYQCRRYVAKAFGMAGITVPPTFHLARHTFGTSLAAAGVDINIAKEFLGHSDVETTQIYYHLLDLRRDEEMGKVNAKRKAQLKSQASQILPGD